MTVAELYAALAGMQADRVVHVRIQGLSRPLEGVFTETEVRTPDDFRRKAWSRELEAADAVEVVTIERLILSDRMYH